MTERTPCPLRLQLLRRASFEEISQSLDETPGTEHSKRGTRSASNPTTLATTRCSGAFSQEFREEARHRVFVFEGNVLQLQVAVDFGQREKVFLRAPPSFFISASMKLGATAAAAPSFGVARDR